MADQPVTRKSKILGLGSPLLWPIFLPGWLGGGGKKRTALDELQDLTVRSYRRIAAQRGCAPTAKTSDQKIWEIATMVGTAFRARLQRRNQTVRLIFPS